MPTNQKQRLTKKVAVAPPHAVHPTGGTSAPKSAAHKMPGVGQAPPASPSPGPLSSPIGGNIGGLLAPPPTPAPTPAPASSPPPESPQRLRERDEGKTSLSDSEGDYKYGLYQAALKYGDPAVIALYGEVANPPTGATQEIAKHEAAGQKTNTLAHNANNTFFSGMDLTDVRNISDEANNDRARALQEFEAAKHELEEAWRQAQDRHRYKEEGFDEGAQREFQESEPAPQAGAPAPIAPPPSSGGGGGGGSKKSGGNQKGRGNGGTTAPAKGHNPGPGVGQAQALKKKKGK